MARIESLRADAGRLWLLPEPTKSSPWRVETVGVFQMLAPEGPRISVPASVCPVTPAGSSIVGVRQRIWPVRASSATTAPECVQQG